MKAPRSVVVANPHALGDALMTFPLAGAVRRKWPDARIYFVGRPYVSPLVDACEFFDGFIDSQAIIEAPDKLRKIETDVFLNPFPDHELARAAFSAQVPIRVGNLFRRSAWYCNRHVAYGSTLSAHVLGFYMRHLRPIDLPAAPLAADHRELFGLTRVRCLPRDLKWQLDPSRFNLILHPKSGGSGREWPLSHYLTLAEELNQTRGFKLFLTGTQRERQLIEKECPELISKGHATDLMGWLPMGDFLAFVRAADGVLASSTGPLHLAAALGRHALGIYGAGLGLSPAVWAPIGPLARTLHAPGHCRPGQGSCPKAKGPPCACTRALKPTDVLTRLIAPALLLGKRQEAIE